ncbi:DUF1800 domain-containing protein [Marivirga salinae]|uniref:DUF1800 domain-containing protein n=1 Tax=Marivirga salinarum TaxID=3059078 RepID=A0AA51REU1_9BACT|nr:DUF1800 domain-containing protein [Marivirga sp. BDSF4-3]WMN13064.1 DUF1800 domain-containing protein [Marivirga sp. BDSF4-3]
MPLTPLTEPLGSQRASHLLRRTVFGATPDLIQEFAQYTPQEALNRLFIADIAKPEPPIDPATGQEWMMSGTSEANSEGFELEQYFLGWQLGQFLGSNTTEDQKLSYIFRERLVYFLHTHFTTKKSIVNNSRALYFQNQLFRQFAFDQFLAIEETDETLSFKDLVIKISLDNAMLQFLDGRLNVKGSPNENYARELLELYSIGRGLEGTDKGDNETGDYGTFTEQDVQEGARILSGFNVDPSFSLLDEQTELPTGVAKGNGLTAAQHDNNSKQLSFRFNNAVISPNPELLLNGEATYESAVDEIKQFIDIIFQQEETAIHICRKIYRFFVYHEVNEEIQNGVIKDMAAVFVEQNFSLQAVLQTLLSSKEFYEGADGISDDHFGSIIKSPLDLIMGHARSVDLQLPDYLLNPTAFYEITNDWLRKMGDMGLNFYEPFEVAGYLAYHQFPIYHRGWITTSYLTQRYAYVQSVSNANMEGMPVQLKTPIEYVEHYVDNTTASNAKDLVIEIANQFLALTDNLGFQNPGSSPLTEERLNYFLDAFLKTFQIDENPEEAWTIRWTQGVDRETVERQLQDLFNAILQSPEYQLM